MKTEGVLNLCSLATSKASFLLNERLYTRLTSETDQIWAIRALEATGIRSPREMSVDWALAAIYFLANPRHSRSVQAAAESMFVNVLNGVQPRIDVANVIVSGLEEWLRQVSLILQPLSCFSSNFGRMDQLFRQGSHQPLD